jgi:hypothetical protein
MQNPWHLLPETGPFVLPCDREIIQNFNNRHRTKQKHQFVIEYFPYPSKNFGFHKDIPSQQYSFYLLKEAMKRDALIIQMRAKTKWQKMNPHLRSYHRYYVLKNWQKVVITEGNCPDGYPEILRELV